MHNVRNHFLYLKWDSNPHSHNGQGIFLLHYVTIANLNMHLKKHHFWICASHQNIKLLQSGIHNYHIEILASNNLIIPPVLYCTLLTGKRLSTKCLTFALLYINFNQVSPLYSLHIYEISTLECKIVCISIQHGIILTHYCLVLQNPFQINETQDEFVYFSSHLGKGFSSFQGDSTQEFLAYALKFSLSPSCLPIPPLRHERK